MRARVVIAGGGVAGLEGLLALRALIGLRVAVTVVTPEPEFLSRPVTVAEAFGLGEARSTPLAQAVARAGGELIPDRVARVIADESMVELASGRRMPYDYLVVAGGAIAREPMAGALTFHGRDDVPALAHLMDELASGAARSVVFALPSERAWSLPVYELALMTAAHVRQRGAQTEVRVVTPEEEPLELFGPAATRAIEPMLEALGIRVTTSARPALVRGRALVLAGGATLYADRIVTLPRLQGPRLDGLPHDRHGFIPVDSHGRVPGCRHVYAAGDITAFGLKQGGLAAQQADAVAESIAAQLGAPIAPRPFRPVLRGLLMTGGPPLYLRCEPQRLPRPTTVAIDVARTRSDDRHASVAARQPLWWPPAKTAGRYLAPFLLSTRAEPLGIDPLIDQGVVTGPPLPDSEYEDAVELALLLAEYDARWGDYRSALLALEAAEALRGGLPPEYEYKRRDWLSRQTA